MTLELARPLDMLAEKTVLLRADLDGGVTPELGLAVATAGRPRRAGRDHFRFRLAARRVQSDVQPAALSRRRIAVSSRTPVSFVPDCVGPRAEAGLDRVAVRRGGAAGEFALLRGTSIATAAPSRSASACSATISPSAGPCPTVRSAWLSELARILPAPVWRPNRHIEKPSPDHGPDHPSPIARPRRRARLRRAGLQHQQHGAGPGDHGGGQGLRRAGHHPGLRGARTYANDIMLGQDDGRAGGDLSGHPDLHAPGPRQQRGDLPDARSATASPP